MGNEIDNVSIHKETDERICFIRGQWVIIDRDLADLYGVSTKVLNQQVKRNIERFPTSFMFELNREEFNELVTICDRFKIIDNEVYLIGASIKDLGKKWFGFTLMESITPEEILDRI